MYQRNRLHFQQAEDGDVFVVVDNKHKRAVKEIPNKYSEPSFRKEDSYPTLPKYRYLKTMPLDGHRLHCSTTLQQRKVPTASLQPQSRFKMIPTGTRRSPGYTKSCICSTTSAVHRVAARRALPEGCSLRSHGSQTTPSISRAPFTISLLPNGLRIMSHDPTRSETTNHLPSEIHFFEMSNLKFPKHQVLDSKNGLPIMRARVYFDSRHTSRSLQRLYLDLSTMNENQYERYNIS